MNYRVYLPNTDSKIYEKAFIAVTVSGCLRILPEYEIGKPIRLDIAIYAPGQWIKAEKVEESENVL